MCVMNCREEFTPYKAKQRYVFKATTCFPQEVEDSLLSLFSIETMIYSSALLAAQWLAVPWCF
jgi:hypothetical protein